MNTNSTIPKTQSEVMREQISNSLEKAKVQKNILKRNNSRYILANVVLAALATLLAGIAGTVGNARNWRPVCLFVAVCSAGVTVTSKLQTPEQLIEASECVGQLKALKVETMIDTYDLKQVSEKYRQILSEYSEIDV
jgi:hypothetical protein